MNIAAMVIGAGLENTVKSSPDARQPCSANGKTASHQDRHKGADRGLIGRDLLRQEAGDRVTANKHDDEDDFPGHQAPSTAQIR